MKSPAPSAIAAAVLCATQASAGVVTDRFSATSEIVYQGDQLFYASIGRQDLGGLDADLDNGGEVGRVRTLLAATGNSLSISSNMGVSVELEGKSAGSGAFTFDDMTAVSVDWNWLHTDVNGGWRIKDALGNVVASLIFTAGNFVSTGGSFGSSQAGNGSVQLGAGTYRFEAFFAGDTMPTGSVVNFGFGAVPAPGAIALLAAAGLVGAKRRRA